MKKSLILITIALLTFASSLELAFCENATSGEANPGLEFISNPGLEEGNAIDDSSESGGAEIAGEGDVAMPADVSAAAAGDVETGEVGKAELLSPLLSESFQTDLATGAATVSIPIVVPPGRKNMQPQLSLSYSSNNPNGICGVGWSLSLSSIQRSTKKGIPKYDNTDTFVFSSSGSTGELIPINAEETEYRQKIETAFMKYTYDGSSWSVYDKNGTKYTFGSSVNSQIENSGKVFAWYLDRVEDVYGNAVVFTYTKDNSQVYLSQVAYTSNASQGLDADKKIEFIYEDRTFAVGNPDVIYNYRSGWKLETRKRLKEIHIKLDDALKWKYVLNYTQSADTSRSLLSEVKLEDASGNSLPPKRFAYQTID